MRIVVVVIVMSGTFWSEVTGFRDPSVFPGRFSYLGQLDPWRQEVILHLVAATKGPSRTGRTLWVSDIDGAISQILAIGGRVRKEPSIYPRPHSYEVRGRRLTGRDAGPVRQRVLPGQRPPPRGGGRREPGRIGRGRRRPPLARRGRTSTALTCSHTGTTISLSTGWMRTGSNIPRAWNLSSPGVASVESVRHRFVFDVDGYMAREAKLDEGQ